MANVGYMVSDLFFPFAWRCGVFVFLARMFPQTGIERVCFALALRYMLVALR